MAEPVIDKALADAFEGLADRRAFHLDDMQWSVLMALLDAPVADNPRLRALLARKPAWDR